MARFYDNDCETFDFCTLVPPANSNIFNVRAILEPTNTEFSLIDIENWFCCRFIEIQIDNKTELKLAIKPAFP